MAVYNPYSNTGPRWHREKTPPASLLTHLPPLEVWVLYGMAAGSAFAPVTDHRPLHGQGTSIVFPAHMSGRQGLVAIASTAGRGLRPAVVNVRGSVRSEEVQRAVGAAMGNASALHEVCSRTYARECLVTDYEQLHSLEVPHGDCRRGTAAWTVALDWLQQATGLASRREMQGLIRYAQYLCSFTASRTLDLHLLLVEPVRWPTFPPGIQNPQARPDILIPTGTVK